MPIADDHYKVTLEDAISANLRAIAKGGGHTGIVSLSNVEGALGRPYHGYHATLAEKAAALFHGVATCHGFADGNKRTAWLLAVLLIVRSGHRIDLRPDDRIDDVAVDVVTGAMSEAEFVIYISDRLATP